MLLIFLSHHTASAFVTVQNEAGSSYADFNGALRLNTAYYRSRAPYVSNKNNFTNMTVLRFLSSGSWKDYIDYDINTYGVWGGGFEYGTGSISNAAFTHSTYRNHWLNEYFYQNSVYGGYGIDRMFIRFTGERANFSLGRMAVNYAMARIFAVNDFFAPFSASSINTVYKPGVDAARLSLQTGNLSTIEVLGVIGNNAEADPASASPQLNESALLLYARTLLGPFDLSLVGGRLAGKWTAGGSFSTDIGPVTLYSEGHTGFLDKNNASRNADTQQAIDSVYVQITMGSQVSFNWRNAVLIGEYAFLSNGTTPFRYTNLGAARRYPDEVPLLGSHYGAVSFTMELHPLLYLNTLGLMNLGDKSGYASVSLAFSIGDNAEWLAGIITPFGKKNNLTTGNAVIVRSEMGTAPFTGFTELRYYF
ncbi:MAG: hypothetical protein JXX29_13230 [Deltaproteobacteria bacterium]|nr:hypothetical protein [Deltaproteobacteria bacterium]MBN2672641.1 hypothetical protein [Deltaproteobacteria bacterium]